MNKYGTAKINFPNRQVNGQLNIKFLLPLIAFIAIAIFLGIGLTLNPRDLPSALIDKVAPSFELELLADSEQTFSPVELQGQRWMLNVWASWCVACRIEHPILNEIANKTNIVMIGLNYKDKPQTARQWLTERGNPYNKTAVDINGDVGIDWGVVAVPETFVIDENGVIIYKHTGPLDASSVQKILPLFLSDEVLAGGG